MIPFFDQFIDTAKKRYHLFLFLCLSVFVLVIVPYIYLGFRLLSLDSYDSLFSMLQEPFIQQTYLSRVILDYISMASFDLVRVLEIGIQNLRGFDIVMLLCVLIAFPILEQKKVTTICILLFILEFIGIGCCVLLGLQMMSLQSAIGFIQIIGWILLLCNLLIISFLLYHLYARIQYYRKAMCYTCVEIKEHRETL